MLDKSKEILKKIFGYSEFRPYQEEIIQCVLNQKNTIAIMPTGHGKSICYQIPALVFEGITIVISPLISLMKDQVEQLHELGIEAVLLNSSIQKSEYENNLNLLKRGHVKLLYIAPESLFKTNLLNILTQLPIQLIAVDEAHCISEWGHDFRPEYREIVQLKKYFPKAVWIALTATATKRVQQDIQKSLKFDDAELFVSSFNRTNLFLEVVPKHNSFHQTLRFIDQFPNQSGIIYCSSRRKVESLCQKLVERGYSAKPYHAGLSDKIRHQNQDLFIKDQVQIMVATIAFGMGVNKSNIRFVLHFDIPKNIESYYQQIGRAGRDSLNSHCLLLYSYQDVKIIQKFIDQKPDLEQQRIATVQLSKMIDYCKSHVCRRIPLISYFGENYQETSCIMCDTCVAPERKNQEQTDLTQAAQKLLSCIKRTGEMFGMSYLSRVLTGSKDKRILQNQHDLISTYGIGLEYSKIQWREIGLQLLEQGYLDADEEYNSLKLNEKSYLILKNSEKFLGIVPVIEKESKVKVRIKKEDYPNEIFEALRKKRKEIAEKKNIPPYIIFHDKTLIELSQKLPKSLSEMKIISGVGSNKLEQYGTDFLEVLKPYLKPAKINEEKKETIKSPEMKIAPKKARKPAGTYYTQEVETFLSRFISDSQLALYYQEWKAAGLAFKLKHFCLALVASSKNGVPSKAKSLSFYGILYGFNHYILLNYIKPKMEKIESVR